MYPKYFGLKEPSFSIAPDPHYLYLSEQHKEALAHLLYGAGESGGFVLLTGEVGTGKTTVCRAFLEQVPDGVDVALILNPAVTANELLLDICRELHVPVPEGERSVKLLVDRLNGYLLEAHARGRRPLLIIDEAQNLRPKVLEQIRLLTNLETTKHKLLQIFLIGQPELRRMLGRESLRQIDQRITARFHLRPFGLSETAEYIRHRIAVAGVDRPLFTAAAIRRIHSISGGIPRLVNILCDRALLGACVTRTSHVTPSIVAKAAGEVRGAGATELASARPAVRPAFAVAAALGLAVSALWLGLVAVGGDPRDPLAWLIEPAVPPEPPAAAVARAETKVSASAPAEDPSPAPALPAKEPLPADPVQLPVAPVLPIAASVGPSVSDSPSQPAPPEVVPEVPKESAPHPAPGPGLVESAGAPPPSPAAPAAAATRAPAPAESLPRVTLASFAPEAAGETLARLSMPHSQAMQILLRRWGLTVVDDLGKGDPCARIEPLGLRCEREQGRLSHVRFFDRPVLLRLPPALGGEPRFAVLGGLDETYATLDLESGSELVPIAGLESVWTGEYTVVWQPPPTGAALIGPGASGDSVRWLRRLLSEAPDSGVAYTESGRFDAMLSGAVREFQSARGLAADGIAGPRTLIQLHNAVSMPGIPHLATPGAVSESDNGDGEAEERDAARDPL